MRVLPDRGAESIKLEPQTRINVDFKPNKKMRKRRELDALVNNGKIGRRTSSSVATKKGQHELLRSVDDDVESESSDEIEFALAAQKKSVIRKKGSSCWRGSGYVPICAFVLVVLCLLVCGGLVWFLYELRREVSSLTTEINTVESTSQDLPDEFQSIHTGMKLIEDKMKGGKGLSYLNSQIESIMSQLKYLNKTTRELTQGQSAAEPLKSIPAKVQQITQNVATLGSTVSSLQTDLSELKSFRTGIQHKQDELQKQINDIQLRLSSTTAPPSSPSSDTEVSSAPGLSWSLEEPSSSSVRTLVDSAVHNITQLHQRDLASLDQRLEQMNTSLSAVNKTVVNHGAQLDQLSHTLQALQHTVFTTHNATSGAQSTGESENSDRATSLSPSPAAVPPTPAPTPDGVNSNRQGTTMQPDHTQLESGDES